MYEYFLLTRVLMNFEDPDEDLHGELSAAAITPDGSLWTGSDEFRRVERLSPIEPFVFGEHKPFHIGDFVELAGDESEIDIEGMDYSEGYLWVTGSHSSKRKKVKGKKLETDLERLKTIAFDPNRYLLARFPVVNGELLKTTSHPQNPAVTLQAGNLGQNNTQNNLIEVLKEDDHLGAFLSIALPSKDNGFDIEGLAVRGNRVFLGLRGPVLRGWAIILELAVEATETGALMLQTIGAEGRPYRKHFVDLNGLGVRELCFHHDDLLILAGPTMDLEGAMEVFRLSHALDLDDDSVTEQEPGDLELLFDLPFTIGSDHAEGMALFPCLGQQDALLIVYDSPNPARRVSPHAIFADVFMLR